MAILLHEIRSAVQTYLNTKVICSIPTIEPAVPNALSPGEEFTFTVRAQNANSAAGGIALTNVRYHIRISNAAIGKLIVPPTTIGIAKSGPLPTATTLTPGSLVPELFLTTPTGTDAKKLDVADIDTITGLKGRSLALGTLDIRLSIIADPDLDFLFPKNENSEEISKTTPIV